MGHNHRICYLCEKKYSYCPTCNEDVYKPSWYAMWCSEHCKEIDSILAAHTVGQISTAEANNMLAKLKIDLSNIEINKEAKEHLNKIINHVSNTNVVADCQLKTSSKASHKKKHGKNKNSEFNY